MKKPNDDFIDLSQLDPFVAATINQGNKRSADAHLSRDDRKRLAKEREKLAARNRKTYDIPPAVSDRISTIARNLSTSDTQVVVLGLQMFLASVDDGLDLEQFKVAVRNPQYQYLLDFHKSQENET